MQGVSRFTNKIALVTGGGQGLGKATAQMLMSRGVKVGLLDVSEKSLSGSISDFNATSGSIIPLIADVTIEDQMKDAISKLTSKFGGIHYAINCAGVAPPAKVLSKKGPHNLEQFTKVMMINVVGTFNCIRLSAEVMSQNSPDEDGVRGVIVNTSSIAAFDGQIGQAAYAGSKGAVVSMTLPIARELAAHGIRVCTIAPGLFLTPLLEGLPEKTQSELASTVPFPKRLGRPHEYAQLVESILINPMLNGETIRLDGALRMQP